MLFDGGRQLAQLRAGQYAEQSSRLGLDSARSQVIFETSVAFYNLVHASQVLEDLRGSSKRIALYANAILSLRSSGRATANDVLRIQLLSDGNRLQVNSATHERERAAVMLASLIGEPEPGDITVQPPLNDGAPELPSVAIGSYPALQSLQRNHVGAAEDLRAANAERYRPFVLP